MAAQLFQKILNKLNSKNIDDRRLIFIVLGFTIVANLFF